MAFRSESHRRWWFANRAAGGTGGGSMTTGHVINVAANSAAARASGALTDADFQDTEPAALNTGNGEIRMPVLGKGWGR